MSQRPPTQGGIMSLFFREWGLFMEQAFKWAEDRVEAARAEDAKIEDRRRIEAEAQLLEQARRAKEAGVDPTAVLAKAREQRQLK